MSAEQPDPATPTETPADGVWVSWYSDGSGTHVHPNEVEALRAAVDGSRDVIFVRWGESPSDAWRRERANGTEDTTP